MAQRHPATEYNEKRRILFSIYYKYGFDKAQNYLNTLKKFFPYHIICGLKAEFVFFVENETKFKLTPAGDFGDCCDFTGIIKGDQYRIDVTTNPDYKELHKYSRFQSKGHAYKIAIMDSKTSKLIDIVDINFPSCKTCDGKMFDMLILSDTDGTNQEISDTQKIVSVCSNDPYSHCVVKDEEFYFIPKFETIRNELVHDRDITKLQLDIELQKHALSIVRFFKKLSQNNIVACGEESYFIIDRDGDGFWGTTVFWKHDLVLEYIDDIYDTIFEIM